MKLTRELEAFYQRAFSRNRGLISEEEQKRLRNTRVAIVGMGGMGGTHAATLARTGIGKFTIADFDEFDVHNINRQYGAMASTVGQEKVRVMESMIKNMNPSAEVSVFDTAIDADNVDAFLEGVDIVVDALDIFAIDARRLIFRRTRESGIPAISTGPVGFSTVMFVFSPEGMSFDTFFGLRDGMKQTDMVLQFLAGIGGQGPHLKYMDVSGVSAETGAAPSLGLACQIGAGVTAVEVINLVLNKQRSKYVPWFSQFDPYARHYRYHYRWLGAKNPFHQLRTHILKRLLPTLS